MNRAHRVEQVVVGVIGQALADAHQASCSVSGTGEDAQLLRCWCARAFGEQVLTQSGLVLNTTNKTALLLGYLPSADILPFGDLYYSQVVELAGAAQLPGPSAELAAACGGAEALDRALGRYYDQRMSWPAATGQLAPAAAAQLWSALEAARFRRARVPLIPKLGSRTLGIDLFA